MIDPLHVEQLQGARILLAENETLIALDLDIMLRQLGCVVSQITGSALETLRLLEQEQPDVTILNPVLHDGSALAVAKALQQRQVPFILVSRPPVDPAAAAWRKAPHLDWPYGSSRLGQALVLAMSARLGEHHVQPAKVR